MVSLGPNFNMSSGATFLSDNTNTSGGGGGSGQIENDTEQLCDPVLATDNNDHFKPLKTIPAFSFHLFVSVMITFTGLILAAIWPDNKRCEAYFIMLYLRAIFWGITLILHHYTKQQHQELYLNGYHAFHRATASHRGVTFYIVSLWNTFILFIEALMQHYYGENFAEKCIQGFFSPIVYITTFCAVETGVLLAINNSYIIRVYRFNKAKPYPDALKDNHASGGQVGLLQPEQRVFDLLEKQADLINYLKELNLKLNQKLMQLNAEVRVLRQHNT